MIQWNFETEEGSCHFQNNLSLNLCNAPASPQYIYTHTQTEKDNITPLQNQNENPEIQHYCVATSAMLWYLYGQKVGYDQCLEPHGSCHQCYDCPRTDTTD